VFHSPPASKVHCITQVFHEKRSVPLLSRGKGIVKIGIYSDVHSNLEALETVLEALDRERVDRTLCLGDLVGYGPNPNECVTRVMQSADDILAGNHDHAALGLLSLRDFNNSAAEAMEWTWDVLTPVSAEFLGRLPLTVHLGKTMAVHATPDAPEEWNYIQKEADIVRNMEILETHVCFIGHSHIPVVFVRNEKGEILIQDASEIRIREGSSYLINVGSVGQPRDGDPRAAYGIFDTEERCFRLKRLNYPVDRVQKKMVAEGLPKMLIERLGFGQ